MTSAVSAATIVAFTQAIIRHADVAFDLTTATDINISAAEPRSDHHSSHHNTITSDAADNESLAVARSNWWRTLLSWCTNADTHDMMVAACQQPQTAASTTTLISRSSTSTSTSASASHGSASTASPQPRPMTIAAALLHVTLRAFGDIVGDWRSAATISNPVTTDPTTETAANDEDGSDNDDVVDDDERVRAHLVRVNRTFHVLSLLSRDMTLRRSLRHHMFARTDSGTAGDGGDTVKGAAKLVVVLQQLLTVCGRTSTTTQANKPPANTTAGSVDDDDDDAEHAQEVIVRVILPSLKSWLQLVANILAPTTSTDAHHAELHDSATQHTLQRLQRVCWPHVIRPLMAILTNDIGRVRAPIRAHLVDCAKISFCIITRSTSATTTAASTEADGASENWQLLSYPSVTTSQMITELLTTDIIPPSLRTMVLVAKSDATAAAQPFKPITTSRSQSQSQSHHEITVWDWHPLVIPASHSNDNDVPMAAEGMQPPWLLIVISRAMLSIPTVLQQLEQHLNATTEAKHDAATADAWCLLLRMIEVWAEELYIPKPDLETETAAESNNSHNMALQDAAIDALVSNIRFLIEWLFQRRSLTPTSSSSNESSATSAVPIDEQSSAVLTILHAMLTNTHIPPRAVAAVHAFLSEMNNTEPRSIVRLLLALLEAADKADGGIMFSELYTPPQKKSASSGSTPAQSSSSSMPVSSSALPAGFTRHTRVDDPDPMSYVNQFSHPLKADDNDDDDSNEARDQPMQSTGVSATQPSTRTTTASPPTQRTTPYSFKSNVLRLIASLAAISSTYQDSFGAAGVYACMSHCVLDDHNPLMREYAILALRNLLIGHAANQRVVEELRMQGVANEEQLDDLGINTSIDEATGKVRVAQTHK